MGESKRYYTTQCWKMQGEWQPYFLKFFVIEEYFRDFLPILVVKHEGEYFMKKLCKRVLVCFLIAAFFWCGSLIMDRQKLRSELIRLHVVGASDSQEDQAVKLQVKDAVTNYLRSAMADISDVEKAKEYLQDNLPKIQNVANEALTALGVEPDAVVTFCEEEFGKRVYDTFALPAGVYDSLRITIGEGAGKNWWCVVFPSLCFSATSEELDAVAAGAGFSEALTGAITGEQGYEVRFYLLDLLGRLENLVRG